MCGIAGIVNLRGKPPTAEELRRMCAAMRHRGPDEDGFHLGVGVGLGMRRLRVIDLETGRQPVCNEDGTVWVVLNGEIYNFRELRRGLEQRGHAFRTSSDTEVIVHLYEEHGAECVSHLRGMFAFALWDTRARTLLLARDRLGIKPLFYAEARGRLAFASELKVLLELPEIERRLNWRAVNHLFSFLATPATESIVAGVHKLAPGHTLTLAPDGAPRINRYWDVRFEPDRRSTEPELVERLRDLLDDAVRSHRVSDVPVGAFLSGGIDSSAVVATLARQSPAPIKTFSIGFREPEFDERRYARRVARCFGTHHRELVLEPDAGAVIDELAWYLDEPFGDPSAIPTYLVSKLAAREVTVALSGDGGDELFAGYDRYLVERRERRWQGLAAPLRPVLRAVATAMPEGARGRNFLRHFSLAGPHRYLDAVACFRPEQRRRLLRPEAAACIRDDDVWREAVALLGAGNGHWLSSLQYFDLKHYLPLDILTKVDRMSMAHSLEARVPLLDHPLVEFAATIPPELSLGATTKALFKRAMRGTVPDEVIDRPKRGFAVPLGRWFRGRLSGFLRERLLSSRARQRGILDLGYVERLIELNEAGRPLDQQLWTLLSFELWCETFLDGRATREAREARADRVRA